MINLNYIICLLLLCNRFIKTASDMNKRIFGGRPAQISEFPYIVQIRAYSVTICGGTLIKPLVVISAAHCFVDVPISRKALSVVGGATTTKESGVNRKLVHIRVPGSFKSDKMDKDVAVLILKSPMEGPNIKPIQLCSKKYTEHDYVRVSGWGQTETAISSNKLLTVVVGIIPWAQCKETYKKISMNITNKMMCAFKSGTKDACLGDSGGPGVINNELCGIVSFGSDKCADDIYPGVYTDVFAIKRFIELSMNKPHK